MARFLLRQLAAGLVLIFVVTAIVFFLTHLNTSQIARSVMGTAASPAVVALKTKELGLDEPIISQYWTWLTSALHGDLGTSYFSAQTILSALEARLPVTLSIVAVSVVITAIVSVVIGVGAAVRGGALDKILQGLTVIGYIFPALLLAILLVLMFGIALRWVPATGYTAFANSPALWFQSIILPAIALAVGGVASVAAQVRGTMIDELSKDYARTLTTRGLSRSRVVLLHALRNAAGPALTTLSLQFISMLGGALIIEQIFALPGFGSYAFTATIQSDLNAVMGVVAFAVVIVVIINIVVDILDGVLNPKARVR